MRNIISIIAVAVLTAGLAAQEGGEQEMTAEQRAAAYQAFLDQNFPWAKGPTTQSIGGKASIEVPEGFRALNASGAKSLMQHWGNIPGAELALFAPDNVAWAITFDFNDVGYVKDDEKDDIDADALMEQMTESQKQGNELRKEQGLETLELVGWAKKPYYDEAFNSLSWATKLRAESGGVSVNHFIKILGRKGVMNATWIGSPDDYATVMPEVKKHLEGFRFESGEKYSDFREGDKIAEYGLNALIVGGGIFAGMKLGFFQRFWKLLVGIFVAIGAFFKKLFGGGGGKKRGRNVYNEQS